MKGLPLMLLCGYLISSLATCNSSSKFVGCWETNVRWRSTLEFQRSGTYVFHNDATDKDPENGWIGKWRVKNVDSDSLRKFIDEFPVPAGVREYIEENGLPKYEIVCYDMVFAFDPELEGKPDIGHVDRWLVLNHHKNELVFTGPPFYDYIVVLNRIKCEFSNYR